jgi:hypothetical protein
LQLQPYYLLIWGSGRSFQRAIVKFSAWLLQARCITADGKVASAFDSAGFFRSQHRCPTVPEPSPRSITILLDEDVAGP